MQVEAAPETTSDCTIHDDAGLRRAVSEYRRRHARIAQIQADAADRIAGLREQIAAAETEVERLAEPHRDKAGELATSIEAYATAERERLFGKARSIDVAGVKLAWRKLPASVQIEDEEAVIAALKRLGRADLVRIKESADKTAIKRERETLEGAVAGIAFREDETFEIKT